MRELKFRVWDFDEKRMVYFEGIFNQRPCINSELTTSLNNRYGSNIPIYDADHKISEVMQYAGFEDKDGKEIYVDDIVYFSCRRSTEVVNDICVAQWIIDSESMNGHMGWTKIIGNKYETTGT